MKDKKDILLTIGLYHAFNDGSVVVIPILFPIFKEMFNLSYTQIGIITGGGLLITLLTQIIVGFLSDKKNRRFLLSLGVLMLSGSLLIIPYSNSFFTLLLFILFLRFASGFYHPTGIGWVSKIFKKEKIDWAMGIQSAFGDFGAFLGIFTTAFIVEFFDWSFPFYIWTIVGILCLFVGLYKTRNNQEELNNNNKKTSEKIKIKKLLCNEYKVLKKVKLFIPAVIMSGATWGIVVSYLPLLLDEKTTFSLSFIGVVVSIWIGIGTIVCIFYGNIASFFGRKKITISSYLILALMAFLLTFVINIYLICIIMVFLGIASFITFPANFSYISEITDETIEGKTFGYILTFQLGVGTILLFLSGLTADIWGIWTPFFILGFFSLIVGIIFLIYHKKLKPLNS
jgi:FSR family fosmidomycin resistance protein-like MFS transporter